MDEDNDIEREETRWEYKEELRRDINRHRGLIDFDIDYDEEEFIKQTKRNVQKTSYLIYRKFSS